MERLVEITNKLKIIYDNNEFNDELKHELLMIIRENMNYIANNVNNYYLDSSGNIQLDN